LFAISLFCQRLSELGNGRFKKTHLQLWDNFLTSIGIEPQILSDSLHPENFNLLAELKQLTLDKPIGYVIGLCGMGGECLCQIYLTAMYKYITLNPYIQSNKETIDWEFWNAINEIIQAEPSHLQDLAAGYQKAKSNWDDFWGNNYKLAERVKLTAVQ
jgi:hypothetical protein